MAYESVNPAATGPSYILLFEALPGNSILVQADAPTFTVLAATPGYFRTLGQTKERLIGRSIFKVFPADNADPHNRGDTDVLASFQHVLQQKQPHHLPQQRYYLRNGDGSITEKYWSAINKPVFAPDGDVAYIIHTAEDITDQLKTNEKAPAIEGVEKASSLFMHAPMVVSLVDGDDHVLKMANEEAFKIWGKGPEIIGKPIVQGLPELQNQGVIELLDQVRTTGQPYYAREVPVTSSNNGRTEQRFFDIVYQPFYSEDKLKPTGVFTISHDVTELVEARHKVEKNEATLKQFKFMADNAQDPFILMREDGTFAYLNRKALEAWGYTEEEALHIRVPDVDPIYNDEVFSAAFAKAQMEEIPAFETLHKKKDGHIYPVEVKMGGLTLNGQPHMFAVARDITDPKAVEIRLRRSEARYRSLFESMDQGFCILEMIYNDQDQAIDYVFLEANPVFEQQTGLKDAVGKTAKKLVPDLEPFWSERYNQVALTGEAIRFTDRSKVMGKWFDVYAFRVDDAEKRRVALLFTDVTERKNAEEAIRQGEINLRNMILQSPVAICIFKGPSFIVEIANDRMFELWGREKEQILEKSIFEAMPEVRNQGYEELLAKVYTTGKTFSGFGIPVTLPRSGGVETVYINLLYEAFREGDGTISGVMAVATDVTDQVLARQKVEEVVAQRTKELAKANEELRRSNQNLEEFAHAASHDLKEPVRKIHFFTQQLKDQLIAHVNEAQARSFNRIENATERMGNLIDDLLLYSHVSQRPLEMEVVNLSEKIQRVMEDLELDIAEKGALIQVAKLPAVKGYRRQLQQLFQNLIGNALKYSKADVAPQINISASVVTENGKYYHLIAVKDNGIGFESEYADKIFQMFTRLHGKSEYSGTGVGLSIVKKVVENHNGFIRVESTPDEGSNFLVFLPAEEPGNGV